MKKIILLIGESGSGKDYLAWTTSYSTGATILPSLTTRKMRMGESRLTHEFVSREAFQKLDEENLLIAKTYFSGEYYGTSIEQLMQYDIYIIDLKGYRYMNTKLSLEFPNNDILLVPIRIKAPMLLRFYRMLKRGDGVVQSIQRIVHDRKAFAFQFGEMRSYWNIPLRKPENLSKLIQKLLK